MADNDVTRIAGNIGAMNALYALTNINKQLSIHQTRLATGKRINSAADDPAGLAISTKMMSRSEGLKVALSNIGDAKNLLAVAESGLGRLTDILNSMRTITENAANDTNGTEERKIVKEQLASYAQQINDIVAQTKWSDKKLIGGAYDAEGSALTFQTGADYGETTKLYGLQDMQASALKLLNDAVLASGNAVATASVSTSYTIATAAVTGTAQLANGDYSVKTTISAVTGGYTYSAQLLAADGVTTVGTAVTGTYSNASTTTLAFGSGISVTLASGMLAAGTLGTVSAANLGTGMTAAATQIAAGATGLASGTYTVDFKISGGGEYSAQVMNGTVAVGDAVTGLYSSGVVVDLKGLSVTLGANMAGTAASISTSAIGTGMTASISTLSGTQTELASGTYTFEYTIAGTTGAYTYSATLLNGTVAVGSPITGTYDATTTPTEIDFGSLAVTLGTGLSVGTDVASNTFNITKSQQKTNTTSQFNFEAGTAADTSAVKSSGNFTYTGTVEAAASSVDMKLSGLSGTVAVSNADDFAAYMKKIDDAMVLVNSQLSKIGSLTGSLTFKEDQVSSSQINIEASYNRIMNANMAEEQVNASKLQILQQTSTAMLAQANAAPQFLLSLFK